MWAESRWFPFPAQCKTRGHLWGSPGMTWLCISLVLRQGQKVTNSTSFLGWLSLSVCIYCIRLVSCLKALCSFSALVGRFIISWKSFKLFRFTLSSSKRECIAGGGLLWDWRDILSIYGNAERKIFLSGEIFWASKHENYGTENGPMGIFLWGSKS